MEKRVSLTEPAAMPQYKRPPITEAVIEIRFEQPLPRPEVDKLQQRFRSEYAFSEDFVAYEVRVNPAARRADFEEQSSGYKLSSADRADVLLVTSAHVTCSRLAPYVGWDRFRARAEDHWRTWKRVTGYRKISRIGVRFINRIDIPAAGGEEVKISDYLRVHPEAPAVKRMVSYAMQMAGPLEEDDCRFVINSSLVPPPLVDHASVILDIDVSRAGDPPQKDDEIWALIDRIRVHKNQVFEESVTDKARELFNA
jgi:uncharacterized protein (TIGR04255 family)